VFSSGLAFEGACTDVGDSFITGDRKTTVLPSMPESKRNFVTGVRSFSSIFVHSHLTNLVLSLGWRDIPR
jgi:hypothetical protein